MKNQMPGGFKPNPIRQSRMQDQAATIQQARQAMGIYVGQHDADFDDAVCECGSRLYNHSIRKKRVSGMDPANPFQPDEQFVDLMVNVCKGCGKEMRQDGPHKNVTFEKPVGVI